MKIDGKNIIVYGLGISGLSAIKALSRYNCKITLLDSKSGEEVREELAQLKAIEFKSFLSGQEPELSAYDLIVKSPGIPNSNKLLERARKMGIEVVSDLELAYRLADKPRIINITGTNGKTTVTSMIGRIVALEEEGVQVLGNIGVGLADRMAGAGNDDIFIVEASSFQLEDSYDYRPKISVITNISPDHIDWHGSYENYMLAKRKSLVNQGPLDYSILNYEDDNLRRMAQGLKSKLVWFTAKRSLEEGVYIEDDKIIVSYAGKREEILDISDSPHIRENLLAAVAAAYFYGISPDKIRRGIQESQPLEHRMELFYQADGVKFINDSKGTNPESTIKALEILEGPIILIGGGHDKGVSFDQLSSHYKDGLKALILMGATGEKMELSARTAGFNRVYQVEDMAQAVDQAMELAESGDTVLLSPACASWGIYNNFEERGREFKELVKK